MSILIKGLTMPETCIDCPCNDGEYGTCNILGQTVCCDGRRSNCPLVAVPEHGDLIDRDELKEQMASVCIGIMAGTDPYNAPLKTIDDAPVVIPEERE